MPTAPVNARLDEELLARVDAEEGANRTEKLAAVVERGLNTPAGDLKPVLLSVSQIASLDQTAARMGLSREEAIRLFLVQRIEREFVEERQRQLQRGKPKAA